MIISEKQIMILMMIAGHYVSSTRIEFGELTELTEFAKLASNLICEIKLQQSEEFKVISNELSRQNILCQS